MAQLEEAWTQKDKFIHSSRMIIRFREDHIARLEKQLKAGESSWPDKESQAVIGQLKEEVKILRDQVKMASFLNIFLTCCSQMWPRLKILGNTGNLVQVHGITKREQCQFSEKQCKEICQPGFMFYLGLPAVLYYLKLSETRKT